MMPSFAKQIFNRRLMWIWLFAICTIFVTTEKSSALVIKSSVWPESLTVGDRFLFVNTVELQPGMDVEAVTPEEKLGDATVLSRPFRLEKSSAGTVAYGCTLAVYQPGPAKIASMSFRSSNSADTTTYSGDFLAVNIKSVLPPDTTGLQIADIKGPRRLREPIWPYLAITLGALLLAFGGGYLYRRFTGKIVRPVAPPIPPWELAFQRLDALKGERHIDFGRFKQYYFELSLIIRGYIEGRYETLAVESTTYELEDDSKLKAEIPQSHYDKLFDFFNRADLIKFAKSIPTVKDAESDLSFAYNFVIETKPRLAPEIALSSPAPEEVKG